MCYPPSSQAHHHTCRESSALQIFQLSFSPLAPSPAPHHSCRGSTLPQPSVLPDSISFPVQREERVGLPPGQLALHPRSDWGGQLAGAVQGSAGTGWSQRLSPKKGKATSSSRLFTTSVNLTALFVLHSPSITWLHAQVWSLIQEQAWRCFANPSYHMISFCVVLQWYPAPLILIRLTFSHGT